MWMSVSAARRAGARAFRRLLETQDAVLYDYCLGRNGRRPSSRPDRADYGKRSTVLPLLESQPVRNVTFNAGPPRELANFSVADRSIASAGCELAGLGSLMSVEDSDLKLVERVQRGERAAFDLLVLRYQHKVLKLIMRYVHDATELKTSHKSFRQGLPCVAVVSRR